VEPVKGLTETTVSPSGDHRQRNATPEASAVPPGRPAEELVANAVEHTAGGAPIELVVELPANGCQVEVHDGDPDPPGDLVARPDDTHPDPWQEHGRGLLLIRTLSSACGHRRTERGKAVWFTLPARAATA
jgi:anti-sigma regulatory factor (Ser/Thr protein kinase)